MKSLVVCVVKRARARETLGNRERPVVLKVLKHGPVPRLRPFPSPSLSRQFRFSARQLS